MNGVTFPHYGIRTSWLTARRIEVQSEGSVTTEGIHMSQQSSMLALAQTACGERSPDQEREVGLAQSGVFG